MKLVATARNRNTGYVHTLRDHKINEKQISVNKDGEIVVSIPISTDGLNGEYNLTITLGRDETHLLAERAYTGRLEAEVQSLRAKLAAVAKDHR